MKGQAEFVRPVPGSTRVVRLWDGTPVASGWVSEPEEPDELSPLSETVEEDGHSTVPRPRTRVFRRLRSVLGRSARD